MGQGPVIKIWEPEVRASASIQMPGGPSGPPVVLACRRQTQDPGANWPAGLAQSGSSGLK